MSFEIARMIVQSYRQSNEQRIKNSMEMAYQEALTAYKSESAARDAALDVLKTETKSFDNILKNIEKARLQIQREDMRTARKNLQIAHKNAVLKKTFDYKVKKELRDREQAELNRAYRQEMSDIKVKEAESVISSGADKDLKDARDWANNTVRAGKLYGNTLGTTVNKITDKIQSGKLGSAAKLLKVDLKEKLSTYLSDEKTTSEGYGIGPKNKGGTRLEMIKYRKADTAHQIMDDIRRQIPNPNEDQEVFINDVEDYLHDTMKKDKFGLKESQGLLKEGKEYSRSDVTNKFNEQVDRDYLRKTGRKPGAVRLGRPTVPGRLNKEVMKPVLQEFLPTRDTQIGRELRQLAQPVFEALRNDFEITAEEQEKLQPEALAAYNKLKEVIIDNPLAVTREEQTLLDDLALQRQYNILQQKRQISGMQPQMASPEVIQARAADIAEPSGKVDASKFTPAQQRYFATERKAYQLSDKTDNDIRNIGIPEKFGLSLFNETFDKGTQSYVPGQSYDTVISRLAVEFEGKPEEGLRALAAYNSRAMALQRASNPLIIDGKQNPDYLAALKELGK